MGTRGNKILTLFGPEPEQDLDAIDDRRGRDPKLIDERNRHILYRVAWYKRDSKLNQVWITQQVAREFYLTESTLGQILEDIPNEVIHEVKRGGNNISMLREKYPNWRW